MPRFDLDPVALVDYRPEVREPADFDTFWAQTIDESRAVPGDIEIRRQTTPLRLVDVFDVRFPGYGGDEIAAWLITPAGTDTRLPIVIEYLGYGAGRGAPAEWLSWATAGYAHLVVDTRGQGSLWGSAGDTPDSYGSGAHAPGFLTKGITSPGSYYYRRVFTDAVRAADAARTLPVVDPDRVILTGTSQGGGIALAAAALAEGIFAVMPDVPFLCHFERAVGMTDREPYAEIVRYLATHRSDISSVFETLGYFDGVNFARRATAPALFSTALLDQTCPPSSVYAAYNHYAGSRKSIRVYPFNDHEGGQSVQWEAQTVFLANEIRRVGESIA